MKPQKYINKKANVPTSILTVFWTLLGVFIFILCLFFIPTVGDLFKGSVLFLLPLIIFSLLGAVLVILVIREQAAGKLKKFLILTGASATGFFVSILLHNLIYGLFIHCFGENFWVNIGLEDEPFFFIIAIIVCPIMFLIGAVGTIYCLSKKKGDRKDILSE